MVYIILSCTTGMALNCRLFGQVVRLVGTLVLKNTKNSQALALFRRKRFCSFRCCRRRGGALSDECADPGDQFVLDPEEAMVRPSLARDTLLPAAIHPD